MYGIGLKPIAHCVCKFVECDAAGSVNIKQLKNL
jgi:hypothetical protein